jgi:hypothetical protein
LANGAADGTAVSCLRRTACTSRLSGATTSGRSADHFREAAHISLIVRVWRNRGES